MPVRYIIMDSDPLPGLVAAALRSLLSEKHLYQNYAVPLGTLSKEQQDDALLALHNRGWDLSHDETAGPSHHGQINLKNIETFCHLCKEVKPCQPFRSRTIARSSLSKNPHEIPEIQQTFALSFKCQGCQQAEIDYFVSRSGPKIRISGRWPAQQVSTPNGVPEALRDHYSKAMITYNAGFELAGVLYLRVLIEQFWKDKATVAATRPTGEELGRAYHASLPEDFKARFPNLLEIYNSLSAAIHTATLRKDLFEDSRRGIAEHFDARRLFKLG